MIPNVVDNNNSIDAPIGCSTISVNEPGNVSDGLVKAILNQEGEKGGKRKNMYKYS